MGVEFHIYGAGNKLKKLKNYIKENPNAKGVCYCGSLTKKELNGILHTYYRFNCSVGLSHKGAVPSKIFELIKVWCTNIILWER